MGRRPKPNVDKAISELKTDIENDVNAFKKAIEDYALKGNSTKCLAEILADFDAAVTSVNTILEGKTPRGGTASNTETVSAASAALEAAITKYGSVDEVDEYVEKLKKGGLEKPKDLKKGFYCPFHIFSPSGTVLNASFTGISVSLCGVWGCFTGFDVSWAFAGTSISGFFETRKTISNEVSGIESAAEALENKSFCSMLKVEMSENECAAVVTKINAVHNAVKALKGKV